MKTVANLKDSIAAILSGIDLGTVDNLDGAIERAARTLVQKADVPEASGIQQVTLFAGVYDYLCDERIFGTAINDIRPQGISRNPWDFATKTDQESFDLAKGLYPSGTMSTFQFNQGVPIIRIQAPFPTAQNVLSPMNSTDGWTAGGGASGLAVDPTFFYQSPASLRFNLAGASSPGYIETTLQSPVDLTNYIGVATLFLAAELPTASDFTSLKVRLGSDSANYYEFSATQGFLGAWTDGVFELTGFDTSASTVTGSPDISSIQYVRCIAEYNGTAQANVRFGYLFISLPSPAEILYQSAAIFKAAGQQPSTDITSNADTVILSNPAYTLLEYEGSLAVLQQTGGGAGDATSARISNILDNPATGLYQMFRGDNPSQELRTVGSWYGGAADGSYGGSSGNSNYY